MNENLIWTELARLPIAKLQDVLLARFVGRDEATKMGLPPATATLLATAISEITRNVIQHAGGAGEIQIGRIAEGNRIGLRIVVTDKGKGIEHPERFLEDARSGAHGSGLLGVRRLADRFDLQTAPGAGTTITVDFWPKSVAK